MNIHHDLKVNGVTYRLLPRKCGKAGCRCNIPGQEHGPYWYAFSDVGNPKYIGVKLPQAIIDHVEMVKNSKAKIAKIRSDLQKKRDLLEQQLEQVTIRLDTLHNLEGGEYAAPVVLKDLGLSQFTMNGG